MKPSMNLRQDKHLDPTGLHMPPDYDNDWLEESTKMLVTNIIRTYHHEAKQQ